MGKMEFMYGVNYGLVLKGEIIERKSFTSISDHVHIALTYICNTICTVHTIYIVETAPIKLYVVEIKNMPEVT